MSYLIDICIGFFFLCLGLSCLVYSSARWYDVEKSWEQVDEDDEVTYE